MSDEDGALDVDVNSFYAADFHQHLAEFRALLSGEEGQELFPSYISPAGYWTAKEKNAFFSSLRAHSRLRPDLIAANIGTKDIFAVCRYLEVLEEASHRHTQVTSNSPGSLEVSPAWVKFEDDEAAKLTIAQPLWENASMKPHARGSDGTTTTSKSTSVTFERIGNEMTTRGNILELGVMKKLDLSHLMVLDAIIRGSEIVDTEARDSGDTNTPFFSQPSMSKDSLADINDDNDSPDVRLSSPIHVDEKALLRTSSPENFSPDSSPATRRRLKKRLYMRRKRAELRGEVMTTISTKLRPGRKTILRMSKPRAKHYKDRKNSLADVGFNGVHNLSSEALETVLTNLLESEPEKATLEDDVDIFVDESSDVEKNCHSGGMTKPYRIRKTFTEQGINASTMYERDLCFFHLSMVGRLLRMFRSGYDDSSPSDSASISADAITLLSAILREFTTEVVYRSINLRNQEKEMKGNIKIWGPSHDEITVDNIKQSLNILGLGGLSKKAYFQRLLKHNAELFNEMFNTCDCSGNDDSDVDYADDSEDGVSSHPPSLTLHREIETQNLALPYSLTTLPANDLSNNEYLMPSETDEDELEADLAEDLALDEQDCIRQQQLEAELWKSAGIDV